MAETNLRSGSERSKSSVRHARNAPLILLAVFASIFILDWAQAVFIPLVLGLIVSYALAPVVDRLEKFRIPRGLSAAVLLLAFVVGVGATAFSLRDEAVSLVEKLPAAVQKMQAVGTQGIRRPGRDDREGGGGGPGDRARRRGSHFRQGAARRHARAGRKTQAQCPGISPDERNRRGFRDRSQRDRAVPGLFPARIR